MQPLFKRSTLDNPPVMTQGFRLFACLIWDVLRNTHLRPLQSWKLSIFLKQRRASTWHRFAPVHCPLWPCSYGGSDGWLLTPAPLAFLQDTDLYSRVSAGVPRCGGVWQKQEVNMVANRLLTDSPTHSQNSYEDICWLARNLEFTAPSRWNIQCKEQARDSLLNSVSRKFCFYISKLIFSLYCPWLGLPRWLSE